MNKIFGWLLIIVCSFFLLIFALTFIVLVINVVFQSEELLPDGVTLKQMISSCIGFVAIITLLVVGIKIGLKKIKKVEKIEIVDYSGTLDISFAGKIKYEDYRNLLFELTFKRPVYYFVSIGLFIFLLFSLIDSVWDSNQYLILLTFLGVCIYPILVFWQSKKNYKTNRIFQEQLNYRLTNDSIHIKGETIDAVQKWTGFYKRKETVHFFAFYQGSGVATLLDKKMFSEKELIDFRQFIQSLNLKKQ